MPYDFKKWPAHNVVIVDSSYLNLTVIQSCWSAHYYYSLLQ